MSEIEWLRVLDVQLTKIGWYQAATHTRKAAIELTALRAVAEAAKAVSIYDHPVNDIQAWVKLDDTLAAWRKVRG